MAIFARPGVRPRGYALVIALIAVVIASLAASLVIQNAQTKARRERETQLLWAGLQIRDALASYKSASPQGAPNLPLRLEDLVEDKRFPVPRRHLRQIYPDPMTGKQDWELIRLGERIVGVHSRSTERPLKKGNFPPGAGDFSSAGSYADWRFVVQ